MDSGVVGNLPGGAASAVAQSRTRPSRPEAEAAVRTLIEWAGDDPDREGLLGTPDRVVRAYEEFFAGTDRTRSRCSPKRSKRPAIMTR